MTLEKEPRTATAANDDGAAPGKEDGNILAALMAGRGWMALLRHHRQRLRRPLLILGPALAVIIGGALYLTGGRYVSTENAFVKADLVAISAEVSGPIAVLPVDDNTVVATGDVLFHIDDRPFRIALARAEAQLRAVADEITGIKAAYRQKMEELSLAQADLGFAQRELDRQSALAEKSFASVAKLDGARHELEVARQRIAVIQQEAVQVLSRLSGDAEIALVRHPRYAEMQAAVDEAALDLERSVVRAPFAGSVSQTPKLGQHVAAGKPVMSLVAGTDLWIEANFKETDLAKVRPGQKVTIRVDTYRGREWRGTVESISQATGAEFSILPPQNATGNWVKIVQRIPVRIAVQMTDGGPALRAGMSTRVEIYTGPTTRMPGFLRRAFAWFGDPADGQIVEGGTAVSAEAEAATAEAGP